MVLLGHGMFNYLRNRKSDDYRRRSSDPKVFALPWLWPIRQRFHSSALNGSGAKPMLQPGLYAGLSSRSLSSAFDYDMKLAEIRARAVLERLRPFHEYDRSLHGAEVGVWRGDMSYYLLKSCPTLHLRMVDSWAAPAAQPEHYRQSDDFHAHLSESVQLGYMQAAINATAFATDRRTIARLPSAEAAARVEDGSLDFVFIDGDHSYEGVLTDIGAWLPKIRPDGFVSGHDYHPQRNKQKNFGVCRAVDEAAALYGWEPLDLGENTTWFVQL